MKLVNQDLVRKINFATNAPATREAARIALSCMDYTSLTGTESKELIQEMADAVKNNRMASFCIYPTFVKDAALTLRHSGAHATTVINFPFGNQRTLTDQYATIDTIHEDIQNSVADGARQVDIVFPYREFLEGSHHVAQKFIAAARTACPENVTLMVILESGAFYHEQNLRKAARLSLHEGVDFLKTSTGKLVVDGQPKGATLQAAAIMMAEAQSVHDKIVGIKVSGGVRSVKEAAEYIALSKLIRPDVEISPQTFRIGASSLFADIQRHLAPPSSGSHDPHPDANPY